MLALLLAVTAFTPDPKDPRQRMLGALAEEMTRAHKSLQLKGHEAPYYIAYGIRGVTSQEIGAKYGALFLDHQKHDKRLMADVRVGSYELDNSTQQELFEFGDSDSGYLAGREAPLDDDELALRNALWLLTDEAYKKSLSAYLKKKGKEVYKPDDPDQPPSFSREEPQVSIAPPLEHPFDKQAWIREARAQTARLRPHPELFDAQMRVSCDHEEREYANTEGTRLVQESALYGLHVLAYARAPDGMLLENSRDFYAATEGGLPRGEALSAQIDRMVSELLALRAAPVLDPYTGPALLAPEAAGVLFHEAVGHRLEGERQNDEKDGHTFKGQIGKPILPAFLSIIDDPTARASGKDTLNGYYKFDEQGVPGQRATLVDHGVLKTFLLSRAPVQGGPLHSNGHGRASPGRDPVARMSNLFVVPAKTESFEELKRDLIAEARRQNKPFGLLIQDMTGGNTDTSGYAYQAFKGQPHLVYKVDATTGALTLVRGVELVGTPLTSINKILAAGSDPKVFNGFCGAESGYVPVSTVAPTVLIGEIELQRTRKDTGRPPVLPSPWSTRPATN
ncbi:MAG TPA: TldD/PmbA family protein [Myxococcales bacterium]|jgi:predicted Zn-dependent protease|nr:TldD/PmbA family protein [Myxococcales bacterium]